MTSSLKKQHYVSLHTIILGYAKGFLGNQPDESTVVLDTYGKNIFYNPPYFLVSDYLAEK